MFKQLQKLGKSFIFTDCNPACCGFAAWNWGALSNANTIAAYPILNTRFYKLFFKLCRQPVMLCLPT